MNKLLMLIILFATSTHAMNNNEFGLIKLPNAATLTKCLNDGGFGELVEKTSIIQSLADQKKSPEDIDIIIGAVRSEYIKKMNLTGIIGFLSVKTKQVCALVLDGEPEPVSKLILRCDPSEEESTLDLTDEELVKFEKVIANLQLPHD